MLTSLRAAAEKAADQLAKAKAAGGPQADQRGRGEPGQPQEFLAAAEKAGARR